MYVQGYYPYLMYFLFNHPFNTQTNHKMLNHKMLKYDADDADDDADDDATSKDCLASAKARSYAFVKHSMPRVPSDNSCQDGICAIV